MSRILRVLRGPRVSRVPKVLSVKGYNIAIYEKFGTLESPQTNVKDRDPTDFAIKNSC